MRAPRAFRVLLSPFFWAALWLVGIYFACQHYPFSSFESSVVSESRHPVRESSRDLWPMPEIIAGYPDDGDETILGSVGYWSAVREKQAPWLWSKLPGHWRTAVRTSEFYATHTSTQQHAKLGATLGSVDLLDASGNSLFNSSSSDPSNKGEAVQPHNTGSAAAAAGGAVTIRSNEADSVAASAQEQDESAGGEAAGALTNEQATNSEGRGEEGSGDAAAFDPDVVQQTIQQFQDAEKKEAQQAEHGNGSGTQPEKAQAVQEESDTVPEVRNNVEEQAAEEAAPEEGEGAEGHTQEATNGDAAAAKGDFDATNGDDDATSRDDDATNGDDDATNGTEDKGSDIPFDPDVVQEMIHRFEAAETKEALQSDQQVIDGTDDVKRRVIFEHMNRQAQKDRARQQLEMDMDVGGGDSLDEPSAQQIAESLVETLPDGLLDDDHEDDRWVVDVNVQHMHREESFHECRKLAWFMAASETTAPLDILMMKMALLSAINNAPSLLPHILWEGDQNNDTDWFQKNGARLVVYSAQLTSDIRQALVNKARASPLREHPRAMVPYFDIPFMLPGLMEPHRGDNTVEGALFLYTHGDVIFLRDVTTCSFQRPALVAVGADAVTARDMPAVCLTRPAVPNMMICKQAIQEKRLHGGVLPDTGVMYVHATELAEAFAHLLMHESGNEWTWFRNDYFDDGQDGDAYDDNSGLGLLTLMNGFKVREMRIPVIDQQVAWKAYLGANDNAAVVHLQGIMPCLACYHAHEDFEVKCNCSRTDKFWAEAKAHDGGAFYLQLLEYYKFYNTQMKWI